MKKLTVEDYLVTPQWGPHGTVAPGPGEEEAGRRAEGWRRLDQSEADLRSMVDAVDQSAATSNFIREQISFEFTTNIGENYLFFY